MRGPWTIAAYKALNLNNMVLMTNALKLKYLSGDNELVLTAQQNDHRDVSNFRFANLESYFNYFQADWIRQLNLTTRVGL